MTTRRRVLSILAGAAALPVLGSKAHAGVSQWRGIALGAEARIILDHPNADALIAQAVSEIHRLENIFSLYRGESQLSRLNRDGTLSNPAFEMVELLSFCSSLHARTKGAFDPTVQALWALYAKEYAAGNAPDEIQISKALSMTGWSHVKVSPNAISFDRAGVMLTLNGIAQGYIADKVTSIFRQNGIANVLVNTGEIVASGNAPNGAAWPIKRAGYEENIPLSDAAIATSAPRGTSFSQGETIGHIIDPRTGEPGGEWSEVSVIANTAAEADGLSTAFCLMDRAQIDRVKLASRSIAVSLT